MSREVAGVLLAAAVAVGLVACSSSAPATSSRPSDDALSGSVTVFAAASLTSTFTELAADFEDAHPGTAVDLNFAGSADLATQIIEGAPADVFASADGTNMARVVEENLIDGAPIDFATNVLQIAVPPSNPAGIERFADLADADVRLVVCAPEVPCGSATVNLEEATGVTLSPVSEESSVTDVLGKVTSGEADAGLVYVTDVIAAGDAVEGIEFDESGESVNTYPIAALTASGAETAAEAFVAFITGETGLSVLAAAGFGAP